MGLPVASFDSRLSLREGMVRIEEMSELDRVGICLSPRCGITLWERRGTWVALGDRREP